MIRIFYHNNAENYKDFPNHVFAQQVDLKFDFEADKVVIKNEDFRISTMIVDAPVNSIIVDEKGRKATVTNEKLNVNGISSEQVSNIKNTWEQIPGNSIEYIYNDPDEDGDRSIKSETYKTFGVVKFYINYLYNENNDIVKIECHNPSNDF